MIKLNAHYLIRASAVLKIMPLIFICLKELKDSKSMFFYNENVLLSLDFLPFFPLYLVFLGRHGAWVNFMTIEIFDMATCG